MKKILLTLLFSTAIYSFASAQLIPSFQFGAKAGLNLSSIQSTASTTFSSSNQTGYLVKP